MNDLLLCKPGEIFLKGLNKHYFEERLVANVKRRLKPIGHFRVTYLQSALYIEAADDAADLDAAYDAVRKVFGIATITRAAACEKDKDAITALAKTYLHDAMTAARSFKVETKRSDKRFPMTSIELSQYVGGELAEAFPNTVVDVHDPELTVRLEVREQAAYVHAQAVEAAGGTTLDGRTYKAYRLGSYGKTDVRVDQDSGDRYAASIPVSTDPDRADAVADAGSKAGFTGDDMLAAAWTSTDSAKLEAFARGLASSLSDAEPAASVEGAGRMGPFTPGVYLVSGSDGSACLTGTLPSEGVGDRSHVLGIAAVDDIFACVENGGSAAGEFRRVSGDAR